MKVTAKHWDNPHLRIYCKKEGCKIDDEIDIIDYQSFIAHESALCAKEVGYEHEETFHRWLVNKYEGPTRRN